MDSAKGPALSQPARDELVQRALELAAGFSVDDPPGHLSVGIVRNGLDRRVDVHAPEQLSLVVIEHRVVE